MSDLLRDVEGNFCCDVIVGYVERSRPDVIQMKLYVSRSSISRQTSSYIALYLKSDVSILDVIDAFNSSRKLLWHIMALYVTYGRYDIQRFMNLYVVTKRLLALFPGR